MALRRDAIGTIGCDAVVAVRSDDVDGVGIYSLEIRWVKRLLPAVLL
jgi:hypothetical protein